MAAKIKNVGKNDKAAEDLAITGEIDLNESFEIDEYAPHPKFTFSKGNTLSQIELGITYIYIDSDSYILTSNI